MYCKFTANWFETLLSRDALLAFSTVECRTAAKA